HRGARDQGVEKRVLARQVARGLFEQRRRSEEHTSELQSRGQLVCRLLLEKKKGKIGLTIDPPRALSGALDLGFMTFLIYRFLVIERLLHVHLRELFGDAGLLE